jgi:hypothetical protein
LKVGVGQNSKLGVKVIIVNAVNAKFMNELLLWILPLPELG